MSNCVKIKSEIQTGVQKELEIGTIRDPTVSLVLLVWPLHEAHFFCKVKITR